MNLNLDYYLKSYPYCPLIICNDEEEFKSNILKLQSMTRNEIEELKQRTYDWVVKFHSYKPTGEFIKNNIL